MVPLGAPRHLAVDDAQGGPRGDRVQPSTTQRRDQVVASKMINDLLHTAIHEAGHAVIGRVLGMICGRATIVPDEAEGEAGHAITGTPYLVQAAWEKQYFAQLERGLPPPKYRDVGPIFHGQIITCMAGAEAENALLGRCNLGDAGDRYEIEKLADTRWAFASGEEWARAEPRMRRQARRLVRKHRDKIERVAKALLQRKSLTPDEVDQLMLG
jgi:hypothetical protein